MSERHDPTRYPDLQQIVEFHRGTVQPTSAARRTPFVVAETDQDRQLLREIAARDGFDVTDPDTARGILLGVHLMRCAFSAGCTPMEASWGFLIDAAVDWLGENPVTPSGGAPRETGQDGGR